MPAEKKREPVYSQIKKGDSFFYQKAWYEDGKRKRKRVDDKEYFEYLKTHPKQDKNPVEEKSSTKPVPAKKEGPVKKDVPVSDRKAIVKDGEITEIFGTIKKVKLVRDEENEKTYILVDVQDVDGTVHKNLIGMSKIMVYLGLSITSNNVKIDRYKFMVTEDVDKVQKEIDYAVGGGVEQKKWVFRLESPDDDGNIFIYGVVSPNWKKVKCKDLMPIVDKAFGSFKKANIEQMPDPSGHHGGRIFVNIPGISDVFDLTFSVDAGFLDGFHAMTIVAGCKILKCLNQLTFDVKELPGITNKVEFHQRQIHAGDVEEFEKNLADMIEQAKTDMVGIVEASMSAKVSQQQQKDILTYFLSKGRISQKDFDELVHLIADKDTTQVPNTMYGLAMAISYRGSHTEKMSDNKSYGLSIVAGEVIVVSPQTDVYLKDIVTPAVKAYEEKKKAEEIEKEKNKK